ncbi:RidA family protein [Polaromonas sp. SM01]|uniref:RidA family protein n=1 Tax=Polaromonas sp. SM01 TaxID=3085630 RepID=UPI002980E94E|nr:RidA family protein [Polaromonas sp. SM01]MDW5443363.1 RidA family protein [Polaromonas sp. SM01]
MNKSTGQPLARYAAWKRVGDMVYMSGVIAVDPQAGRVIERFDDLPDPVRRELGETGELSVDIFQAPALVQSWFVLDRIRQLAEEAGGSMDDVFKLVQYFTDLRDYPLYNRVRRMFYPGEPPVSTVVEVSGMLPSRAVRIEVEATAYIPLTRPGAKALSSS